MSVRAGYGLRTGHEHAGHLPVHYVVIGQEGVMALGGLLSRTLRYRRLSIAEQISFDYDRELTLYEVKVPRKSVAENHSIVDLMICLNNRALDYEQLVKKAGTLLLDANRVDRRPNRRDVEIVAIPAFGLVQDITRNLSQETMDRFDPAVTSLFGCLEGLQNEYPEPDVLKRVFENLQIEPAGPFLSAVYRGYDWLQETRVRCKTAWGGATN